VTLRPMVFDRDVLALDVASFANALLKCGPEVLVLFGRAEIHETDHRHRRLLRARSERPRHRTAERGYQFPPLDLDCHVTLPWGSCPCNKGNDITL
jgi:hypothetical protein